MKKKREIKPNKNKEAKFNDGSVAIKAIKQGMIKQHGADKVKVALNVAKLQRELTDVLAEQRVKLNISQAELASQVDTTQKQISRYERGEQAPSLGKLLEWCLEVGVDLTLTSKKDNKTLFHT